MYLLEKVVMAARNHTLMRRHEHAGGVFDFAGLTVAPRSIGFALWNPKHVKIGDQFFLEPIMRACRLRGVPILVSPTPAMEGYFRDAGFDVGSPDAAMEQELRIATVSMYDTMPRAERRRRVLYVNTIDHHIDGPVSAHLARHVVAAAGLDPNSPPIDGKPHLVAPGPTLLGDTDGRWLVYSDAVDSGWFRVLPSDRRALARIAESRREEGFLIVRVGSAAELSRHREPLPFDHLDLRGRTSVLDLFRLIASPTVAGTISFDTAVAHIGIAYGKPAEIRLRRFSAPHARFLKRHLIPPFKVERAPEIRYV